MKWINRAAQKVSADKMPYLIQIYGTRRVVFEACRRILEYTPQRIVIEGESLVTIEGRNLELKELGNSNLAAVGVITALHFEKKR